MKKLLYKTALFTGPFFLFYLVYINYYSDDRGDLSRLGYIPKTINYDFKVLFKKELNAKVYYRKFSELNLNSKNKFNILTVGDSFSEQDGMSYQNYIDHSLNIVHYDRFLHNNPIETVNGLVNGDVLNNLKVDYIILQSVERFFVERGLEVKNNNVIKSDSLKDIIVKYKEKKEKETEQKEHTKDKFFNRDILLFPLNNIVYNFRDKGYYSRVHQVKTTKNLFITNNNKLLFYDDDYNNTPKNNDINNIKKLNDELNLLAKKLKQKGIQLIVLPCPDKFDLYYDYIANKKDYEQPLFFDHLRQLKKEYLFVDAKKILQEETKKTIDVYFYDDTHWSPIATKVIGPEIGKIIKNNPPIIK